MLTINDIVLIFTAVVLIVLVRKMWVDDIEYNHKMDIRDRRIQEMQAH